MIETLKKNIRNKMWWVAIISAVIVLAQSFGLDLIKYIGVDWQTRLNTVFSILVLLGISVDTTTNGGNVLQDSTENTIQAGSDSTNTNVDSNSNFVNESSAKVKVDNPDNVQTINANVNSTSANAPR